MLSDSDSMRIQSNKNSNAWTQNSNNLQGKLTPSEYTHKNSFTNHSEFFRHTVIQL